MTRFARHWEPLRERMDHAALFLAWLWFYFAVFLGVIVVMATAALLGMGVLCAHR